MQASHNSLAAAWNRVKIRLSPGKIDESCTHRGQKTPHAERYIPSWGSEGESCNPASASGWRNKKIKKIIEFAQKRLKPDSRAYTAYCFIGRGSAADKTDSLYAGWLCRGRCFWARGGGETIFWCARVVCLFYGGLVGAAKCRTKCEMFESDAGMFAFFHLRSRIMYFVHRGSVISRGFLWMK